MKKRSKKLIKIMFIIVFILGVVGAGVYLVNPDISSVLSGGWTTLSLSSVNVVSNDPDLQGQAWILNVIHNGAGQYAVGNFNKDQITDEGKKALYDFKLTSELKQETCNYPVNVGEGLFKPLEQVAVCNGKNCDLQILACKDGSAGEYFTYIIQGYDFSIKNSNLLKRFK